MNHLPSPSDQAKVFFFLVLQLGLIRANGIGLVLISSTLGFFYLFYRTQNFSFLETLRIIHKICAGVITVSLVLYNANLILRWIEQEFVIRLFLSLLIYPAYSFLVDWLFYIPVVNNKEWLESSKLFTKKPSVSSHQ